MNATAPGLSAGVYTDEVFTATELNRRVGTILDRARVRPVTITRNHELFALVRREYAAGMIQMVRQMKSALEVLAAVHLALAGEPVAPQFSWLDVFEKDDLQRFASEVFSMVAKVHAKVDSEAADWREVEAVLHEWRESALVAKSGVLDAAVTENSAEECPLCHPDDVLPYLGQPVTTD